MTAYASSTMLNPGDWPLINADSVFDTQGHTIFFINSKEQVLQPGSDQHWWFLLPLPTWIFSHRSKSCTLFFLDTLNSTRSECVSGQSCDRLVTFHGDCFHVTG